MMRVIVITPPDPIVTWEEADAHLRLLGDETERVFVEGLIAAATAHLDGPSGWLGRALGPQTLEARFDSFWPDSRLWSGHVGCRPLRLPYPPLIDIVSVKYMDATGTEQTVNSSAYEVRGQDVGAIYGTSWPAARWQPEAVRIRYRAGYAEDPEADPLVPNVPPQIKAAILLMVGDMFRWRETAQGIVAASTPTAQTLDNLLGTMRVFG